VDRGARVVAVRAGGEAVRVRVRVADRAVAVVIDGVRALCLGGAGEGGRVEVVAVRALGDVAARRITAGDDLVRGAEAVTVGVLEEGGGVCRVVVDDAVAVVVDAVAELVSAGADRGVGVVAVVSRDDTVAISVDGVGLIATGDEREGGERGELDETHGNLLDWHQHSASPRRLRPVPALQCAHPPNSHTYFHV